MRIIFRKKETAHQNLNQKLNKKNANKMLKEKAVTLLKKKIATTSSTQGIQAKLENLSTRKVEQK